MGLLAGFDLARIGLNFISGQCGPKACDTWIEQRREEWEQEKVGNWAWAGSFMSRGFRIEVEERHEIAPLNWKRLRFSKRGRNSDMFCDFKDYNHDLPRPEYE